MQSPTGNSSACTLLYVGEHAHRASTRSIASRTDETGGCRGFHRTRRAAWVSLWCVCRVSAYDTTPPYAAPSFAAAASQCHLSRACRVVSHPTLCRGQSYQRSRRNPRYRLGLLPPRRHLPHVQKHAPSNWSARSGLRGARGLACQAVRVRRQRR